VADKPTSMNFVEARETQQIVSRNNAIAAEFFAAVYSVPFESFSRRHCLLGPDFFPPALVSPGKINYNR
jgi:hypothetical protein